MNNATIAPVLLFGIWSNAAGTAPAAFSAPEAAAFALLFTLPGEIVEVRPCSPHTASGAAATYAVSGGRYRRLPIRTVIVPPRA